MDQSVVDAAGLNQGPLEREIAGIRARREPLLDEQAKLRQQRGTIGEDSGKIIEKQAAETQPAIDAYVSKAKDAPRTELKEERMQDFERPQFDQQELNQTFGALMVASLILGSASRGPYNNVMGAMTGAINGFLKGDHDNVEEQFKVFDKNLVAMKERNTAIRDELQDAEKKWSHDLGALKTAYETVAAKYDLPLAQQALKDKNLAQAQQEIWREITSLDTAETRLTTTVEQGRIRLEMERGRRQAAADAREQRQQAHDDNVKARADSLAERKREFDERQVEQKRQFEERESRLGKPKGAEYDKIAKEYMAASQRLYQSYAKQWNKANGDKETQDALSDQYSDSIDAMIEGYENRGLTIPRSGAAAKPGDGKPKTDSILKFDAQGKELDGET